ncbi:D-glutamate cyclase family protein [Ornithinimicrobium cavernae]|uniref:D-glutamate cyclase family protein n=1 Tax=Ornithinimicrobium cavernae TaxID=2666047 RepID=UPI001F40CA0E|nr:DUF1445 domain-containing protein [Ornithinimicrobium cavernae]
MLTSPVHASWFKHRARVRCGPADDLQFYRVWRDGELVDEVPDISGLWQEDLVSFLIGCSFSFERALLDAGVPVLNIEQGRNVAMYRTNRQRRPTGRRSGELVVMRQVPAAPMASRSPFAITHAPGPHVRH